MSTQIHPAIASIRRVPKRNGTVELWVSYDPQELPGGRIKITDFLYEQERAMTRNIQNHGIPVLQSGIAWQGPATAPQKAEATFCVPAADADLVIAIVSRGQRATIAGRLDILSLPAPGQRQSPT